MYNGILCIGVINCINTLCLVSHVDSKYFYIQILSDYNIPHKIIKVKKRDIATLQLQKVDDSKFDNSPLTSESFCQFTWGFGSLFLLRKYDFQYRVSYGDFYVWADPEYGGDNIIKKYTGFPQHFSGKNFCGRAKGQHSIYALCGDSVKIEN